MTAGDYVAMCDISRAPAPINYPGLYDLLFGLFDAGGGIIIELRLLISVRGDLLSRTLLP